MNIFAKIITILVILLCVAGAIDVRRIKSQTHDKIQNIDTLARNTAELAILDMDSSGEIPRWNNDFFQRKIDRKRKIYLLLNETSMKKDEIDRKVLQVDQKILKVLDFQLEFELRETNLLVEMDVSQSNEIISTIERCIKDSDYTTLRDYLISKDLYRANLKEILEAIEIIKKKE